MKSKFIVRFINCFKKTSLLVGKLEETLLKLFFIIAIVTKMLIIHYYNKLEILKFNNIVKNKE